MISRQPILFAIAGFLALTVLFPQSARSQGVVRDSIAPVSSGRGGANIAHFDNLSIILDNPAGLANLRTSERFEIGIDLLVTDLDYRDRLNNTDGEVAPFPIPQIAFARKSADGRFAYGIGVFTPAGFGARYRLKHALYGKREYSSLGALIKILPAVAYRLTDRLSVGATFGLAFSHIQLEKPFNLQTGLFAGVPTLFDMKASGVAPTWSAGLQYKLTEKTMLGIAYRGETRFRLKGDSELDISGVGFPLLKASYDTEVDLVWPRSLGVGLSHNFNERHQLSSDVVWFNWSHAYDKLDLRLSDGSNPLFDALLGSTVRDTFPLGWADAIAYRIGYEYSPTPRDVMRLGFVYHDNPIPNSTLIPNLAGILEYVVSVGYGHLWKNWGIDLAYQYSWGSTNRVGRSQIVGGDYDHSSVKAQAHWLFVGMSYTF